MKVSSVGWWCLLLVVLVTQAGFVFYKSLSENEKNGDLDASQQMQRKYLVEQVNQLKASYNTLTTQIQEMSELAATYKVSNEELLRSMQQFKNQAEQAKFVKEGDVKTPTYSLLPLQRNTTKGQCKAQICHGQCDSRCGQLPRVVHECRRQVLVPPFPVITRTDHIYEAM